MKDAAKLNYMRAPKYLGRKIIDKDSLPSTFVDLQHQIEQALKQGATEEQVFAWSGR